MAPDEDEDLYDEEFDFVDDDDESDDDDFEDEGEDEEELKDEARGEKARAKDESDEPPREGEEGGEEEGPVDEYGRPEQQPANYLVHIYEHSKFKRTIERPFTAEDAESFATEFNRTSKSYGRIALTSKNDAKPKKVLE